MATFTVTGRGAFPIDMLRFDECWPVRQGEDVGAIVQSIENASGKWQVRLRSDKHTAPTVKRWESFCCTVEIAET
jgi:hypothetical protein